MSGDNRRLAIDLEGAARRADTLGWDKAEWIEQAQEAWAKTATENEATKAGHPMTDERLQRFMTPEATLTEMELGNEVIRLREEAHSLRRKRDSITRDAGELRRDNDARREAMDKKSRHVIELCSDLGAIGESLGLEHGGDRATILAKIEALSKDSARGAAWADAADSYRTGLEVMLGERRFCTGPPVSHDAQERAGRAMHRKGMAAEPPQGTEPTP